MLYSPTNASYDAAAHTGSIAVTCGTGCGWWAASNASWITITSGSTGSGSGTVNYSVAANTSTSSRTGTLAAGGQTFTLTQQGQACTYAISPTNASYDAAAQAGKVTVTTSPGCTWTATSTASWIALAPDSGGTGNGTVSYSVGPNSTTQSHTDRLTIANQTFTVTQGGQALPVISVSPSSLNFDAIHRRTLAIKTVTVSNAGGAKLTISSAAPSGTNANQFSRTTNCGTVAPNGSCSIQVTFSPTSSGKKSANLKIYSNDPSTPALGVSLTGSGR